MNTTIGMEVVTLRVALAVRLIRATTDAQVAAIFKVLDMIESDGSLAVSINDLLRAAKPNTEAAP